jgi:hypothetical protein
MSSKLVPQNAEEVMVIREIAPNVTTLSVPFLRFGRIKFGGRATIGIYPSSSFSSISLTGQTVKLRSGSLAVFSPVALTPTVRKTIGSSPVTYLGKHIPILLSDIFILGLGAENPGTRKGIYLQSSSPQLLASCHSRTTNTDS